MAENPTEVESQRQRTQARLKEAERVLAELIKAVQAIEEELGEEFMAEGIYYGIKFG